MKNEKICPFHGGCCDDRCGLFDSFHSQCSIVSIATTLESIDGSLEDAVRVPEDANPRTDEIKEDFNHD